MNKSKYFEQQLMYWGNKFNISNLTIRISVRLTKWTAMAYWWREGNKKHAEVIYSPFKLKNYSKVKLTRLALHELGHTLNRRTQLAWKKEYNAEKFALATIKKYMVQYYDKCIKYTRLDYKWYRANKRRAHELGFKKLLDEVIE